MSSGPIIESAAGDASLDAATFLFADLAGYSALTEAHGDARAADEAAAFCDGVRKLLGEYEGEEVKAVGDALIVRLKDAGRAVHLAARIAGDFGARDRALGVRVGMHTGTAVKRGNDWFGSAINVASRIADLAHSGEVFLSEATRQAAGAALSDREVSPRGRRQLKNVPDPVAVFALVSEGQDAARDLPVDPVCRMVVDPAGCEEIRVHRGVTLHFCSEACAEAFDARPQRYMSGSRSATKRVSDQARDAAARQVARAYAEGRLEAGELEERTEMAWSARTRADLEAVTHDLPRRRRNSGAQWGPLWPLWLLVQRLRRRRRRLGERRAARRLDR